MKKHYVVIMILLISIISYFFYQSMFGHAKSGAFAMLPESARDVQEFYKADGFNGDYVHLIKAKIIQADYFEYVNRLKMPSRYESNINNDLKSKITPSHSDAPKWWDPPDMNEMSYYEYNDSQNSKDITIYSNGYVYYYSAKW